ncbi:hypothetical protein D3C71_1592170 [compost metagenome]
MRAHHWPTLRELEERLGKEVVKVRCEHGIDESSVHQTNEIGITEVWRLSGYLLLDEHSPLPRQIKIFLEQRRVFACGVVPDSLSLA